MRREMRGCFRVAQPTLARKIGKIKFFGPDFSEPERQARKAGEPSLGLGNIVKWIHRRLLPMFAVKEIFYTLQGEGRHAGRAAVFCRFAGCNLWSGLEKDRADAICTFCDTDFVGVDGQAAAALPMNARWRTPSMPIGPGTPIQENSSSAPAANRSCK